MELTRKRTRGSTLIEFTLVGIPLIFVLISTFEIARGMWMYETLAYAVREGTRFAIVHGQGCATAPHSCRRTVGQLAQHIANAGVGLLPDEWNVTITATGRTYACNPLSSCLSVGDCFPSSADCTSSDIEWAGMPGMPVTIEAGYPFRSAIAMFWPGGTPVVFGTKMLWARSREGIQF
jgi:hypothetical protein